MSSVHDFRHPSGRPTRHRLTVVDRPDDRLDRLDQLGRAAGLLTWLAVGVPVALGQRDGELAVESSFLWWAAYVGYGAVIWTIDRRGSRLSRSWLLLGLAVQVALGMAVFVLAPGWGFTAVLLVISAASATELLRLRRGLAVVAGQTLLVLLVAWPLAGPTIAVTTAVVFGGFQVFAALMVETRVRETELRTALALANAELQATRALLAEVSRDTERLRISRELHDLLGHRLTALSLDLEVAAHTTGGDARDQVVRSRDAARSLLGDVRSVVGALREPPTDLAAELLRVTRSVSRPRTHLQAPPELVVENPDRARAVLRCVQELITNAVRHAEADNLWIEVSLDEGQIVVRAHDDGRGVSDVHPGHGLTGMRERFEALGGRVRFVSADGAGFGVQAVLPR